MFLRLRGKRIRHTGIDVHRAIRLLKRHAGGDRKGKAESISRLRKRADTRGMEAESARMA